MDRFVARRLVALLVVVAAAVAAAVVLLGPGGGSGSGDEPAPGVAPGLAQDPFRYHPDARRAFEQRAAAGLAHVLYAKSPGGAVASARRTARWLPLIRRATAGTGIDPLTVEAIVLLESAGRPDGQASDDLRSAVGLTQILAQTATGLLGLHVDLAASARLTRRIALGGPRLAAREAERRRVDERFDPAKALAGTVRYLRFARGQLHGRDDLAVASYHMGVGNLQTALARYGDDDVPYAQLFFDSTPLRHPRAWSLLASLGDDSSTYLWRIGAAREILHLQRSDPASLARLQALQGRADSQASVLRPPGGAAPRRALLDAAQLRGLGVGLAASVTRPATGGAATLDPVAHAALQYLGRSVRRIAGTGPLTVTAAGGYVFALSRRYRSHAQAEALQFVLDRLTALDVIAWERAGDVIVVTVGRRAAALL